MKHGSPARETYVIHAASLVSKMSLCFDMAEGNGSQRGEEAGSEVIVMSIGE